MDVAELTDTLQNTTLDDSSVLFSPHEHTLWSNVRLELVPRFLFRVYTPHSDGLTNETVASSRDAASGENGTNVDVFATRSPNVTAALIADHMLWTPGNRRDNLVSWSSSILFLIRYIFYRHHNDGSSLRDIRLLVVDTEQFQARTFIRDTDLILAFRPFDGRKENGLEQLADWRANKLYFGEYLSQGSLPISGKCSSLSAQTMIDRGLLELHEVFRRAHEGEQLTRWAIPVQDIRETIRTAPRTRPASLNLTDIAFDIALEFGKRWQLPIAVQLLAILPHGLERHQIYHKLCTRIGPEEREVHDCAKYWQIIHAPLPMAELIRGQSIMKVLLVTHVQAKFDLLRRARTFLSMNLRILAQNSGEYSAIVDALQNTLDTLFTEDKRLGELVR